MTNQKNPFIEAVEQWHKKFKQPIGMHMRLPSRQRYELRESLLLEEIKELEESYRNGDFVRIADSFADIMFVLCGTIIEFGLQDKFDDVFREVTRSNNTKLGEDGLPMLRDDGKVLKGKFYEPPNLGRIIHEILF
jgi:predicted HAD superfamily Cof-like phosphohydrolase